MRWLRRSDQNLVLASKWANEACIKLVPDSEVLSSNEISVLAKNDLPGIRIKDYPRIPFDILLNNGFLHQEFELLKASELISQEIPWEEVRKKFNFGIIEYTISNYENFRVFEEMELIDTSRRE